MPCDAFEGMSNRPEFLFEQFSWRRSHLTRYQQHISRHNGRVYPEMRDALPDRLYPLASDSVNLLRRVRRAEIVRKMALEITESAGTGFALRRNLYLHPWLAQRRVLVKLPNTVTPL